MDIELSFAIIFSIFILLYIYCLLKTLAAIAASDNIKLIKILMAGICFFFPIVPVVYQIFSLKSVKKEISEAPERIISQAKTVKKASSTIYDWLSSK